MEQRNTANLPPESDTLTALDGFSALVHTAEDRTHTLRMYVEGIHCVGCIATVENTVKQVISEGDVRLNVTTSILQMKWQGDVRLANQAVDALEAQGYTLRPIETSRDNQELKTLILCMGVAGFAMGNVMLISVGLWMTDSATMGESMRTFLHWISALIAIPTLLFSGRPFYVSAWQALSHGRTNMDIPISVGLFLTVAMSFFETLIHGEHVYFDSAVMLMFFLLVGRVLDMKTKSSASESAQSLQGLLSGFARVVTQGKVRSVPLSQVGKGSVVRVPMGERFPLDGTLLQDAHEVDTSIVSGESVPQSFFTGEAVYGGMLNLGDSVEMQVTSAHDEGVLHHMSELIASSSTVRSRYTRLADKVSQAYTPVVHVLALLAFAFWIGIGASWQDSLLVGVTVLIITCPCALGLSVPVVHVRAIGRLMKQGVFMKQGDALERLSFVDTILFDKTGTLTAPRLADNYVEDTLRAMASLAAHSRHPLSQAIVAAFDGPLKEVAQVKEIPGKGVEGLIDSVPVRIGKAEFVGGAGTGMWLSMGDSPPQQLTFHEGLLPQVEAHIQALKAQGYKLALVTGDSAIAAEKINNVLQFDEVFSQQTPTDKVEILSQYQKEGRQVLMVGDGINDAAVLSHAHASLAPVGASDLARTQADGVYVKEGIGAVLETLRIAKAAQMYIGQNIAMSSLYNVVAVPLAFAGFITPLIAAIAMSASSLVVTLNAFRLK